ncbi:triose-phosphate isomerase [soil metagenome]
MTLHFRRPLLAGNWKMYQTPAATQDFFSEFLPLLPDDLDGTVIFFPPALSFSEALRAVGDRSGLHLGVQNVHWEQQGAFTGENSVAMARDAGAELVLVGHSERRHLFGETDEEVLQKVQAVLAAGLIPLLCVGETLEQREEGRAVEIVQGQLSAVFQGLSSDEAEQLLIAYEPVWAIGTGKTASSADAEEMHSSVRTWLSERMGAEAAAGIPILYGGSVKPENAGELLRTTNVDGVLVGGASLDPVGFARICTALS